MNIFALLFHKLKKVDLFCRVRLSSGIGPLKNIKSLKQSITFSQVYVISTIEQQLLQILK